MGEPAYRLPEDDEPELQGLESRPSFGIYDGGGETSERTRGHLQAIDGDSEADGTDDNRKSPLQSISGGGESTKKSRGHLSSLPTGEDAERAGLGMDAASNKAASAAIGAAGGTAGQVTMLAKAANSLWGTKRRRNTTVAAGGVGGGIIGIIIGLIFLLAPLKVVSMMQNLQDHFSASSEQAASDATETLMQHYLVKKVMPGMAEHKCRTTKVSKSCAKISDTSNLVGQLYEAWRQGNLEGKMATDYGIEIMRDTTQNKFYLKTKDLDQRIELGTFEGETITSEGKTYAVLNRTEFRNEFNTAVKNETSWKQMLHRYGLARLAESKYGARLCLFKCTKTGDKVADTVEDKKALIETKKVAFKSWLVDRVIKPRNEMYALTLQCALQSFACNDGDSVDDNGEHSNNADRDLQTRLNAVRDQQGGEEKLKQLKEDADKIKKNGVSNYLIEKLAGEVAAQFASKTLPVAGWISLAASILTAEGKVGPALTHLNYTMYETTAVQVYSVYRISADEMKSGNTDMTVAGSVASSLDASDETDQGGKSATQTPLYQNLYSNGPSGVDKETSEYCDDGDSIPKGELECSHLITGARGTIRGAQIVSTIVNKNPLTIPIRFLSDLIGWLTSHLSDILGGILDHIPGYSWIEANIAELTTKMLMTFVKYVIPNPLGDDPSGGRLFDLSAAGADFLANDYAHYGQGGQKLSDAEVAAIRNEQTAGTQYAFAQKSLYARMFDTGDTNSLVSHVALAVPSSVSSGVSSTVGSFLSNPLGSVFSSFSTLLTGKSSASTDGKDPFGITQYGLTKSALKEMGDPEVFWKENCSDLAAYNKQWGEKATKNSDTEQYENDTPNFCLLIKSSVMAAGGKFDTSLIPDYNDSASGENSGAGMDINIATFNVRGSSHTAGDLPGDPGSVRIKGSADFILAKDFDVVGLQELQLDQRQGLMDKVGDKYSIWPDSPDNIHHRVENSIIYKDAKKLGGTAGYELVDKGIMTGKYGYFGNNPLDIPWVKLRDVTTQQEFVVENTHDPVAGTGSPIVACQVRASNARQHLADAQQWESQGLPVFITGDFNSTYYIRTDSATKDMCANGQRSNLPYCIMTATGDLVESYDASKNRGGPCPTDKDTDAFIRSMIGQHGNLIDHVYVSSDVSVGSHQWFEEPRRAKLTDHAVVGVEASVGQSADTGGAVGGWVWPQSQIYPGPCWNSHSTGSYHAGMDMNVRKYGLKAGAAHSGTVIKIGTDDAAGNYVTVKVNSHLYYSYEHLASVSTTLNKRVVAGEEIGIIGRTGNVILSSSVAHLHMTVSVDGGLGSYSSTPQTGTNTRDPLNYLPNKAPNGYACTP